MQAFVPKNRRPKFELTLKIIDLNNIPLVCGTSYVKWYLPTSTSAEHRGRTDRAVIQDHHASWDYEKTLPVRLMIDRNHMLQDREISFEIFQEFTSGSRGSRILLGNIRLNLAEYADKSEDAEFLTRRYLMQDSKINSTLRVGIIMRQVEGDKNYVAPPLKSAMVFGGIAGILPSEHEDPDNLDRIPIPSIKISRETGDLQEMYRRTLTASWTCREGELPPDELIEEIFAGGSGWTADSSKYRPSRSRPDEYDGFGSTSDTDSKRTIQDHRLSPNSERRPKSSGSLHPRDNGTSRDDGLTGSIDRQLYGPSTDSHWRKNRSHRREVSEFSVREDLRSWEILATD